MTLNPLRNRIRKLESSGPGGSFRRGRLVRMRDCTGLTVDELLKAVVAALPPGGEAVAVEINNQAHEYESRPPYSTWPGGSPIHCEHGFTRWLIALMDGWAKLPPVIPLAWLEAWRDGFTNHPAKASPVPILRCDNCWMVYPNEEVKGKGAGCLICGSSAPLYWQDFGKPDGHFHRTDTKRAYAPTASGSHRGGSAEG